MNKYRIALRNSLGLAALLLWACARHAPPLPLSAPAPIPDAGIIPHATGWLQDTPAAEADNVFRPLGWIAAVGILAGIGWFLISRSWARCLPVILLSIGLLWAHYALKRFGSLISLTAFAFGVLVAGMYLWDWWVRLRLRRAKRAIDADAAIDERPFEKAQDSGASIAISRLLSPPLDREYRRKHDSTHSAPAPAPAPAPA